MFGAEACGNSLFIPLPHINPNSKTTCLKLFSIILNYVVFGSIPTELMFCHKHYQKQFRPPSYTTYNWFK